MVRRPFPFRVLQASSFRLDHVRLLDRRVSSSVVKRSVKDWGFQVRLLNNRGFDQSVLST